MVSSHLIDDIAKAVITQVLEEILYLLTDEWMFDRMLECYITSVQVNE